VFLRRLLFVFLSFILVFSAVSYRLPAAAAGEIEDAQVAFGAFSDGLYDFAGSELTQFLVNYPHSKLASRARLTLVLCSLETGDCRKAAQEFGALKKPVRIDGVPVDPAELQLRIGECFLRAGERQKAAVFFTGAIKESGPGDIVVRARFKLAHLFFADKKFAAAAEQTVPLLKIAESAGNQSLKFDSRTVLWIAALSRYQLKKYAAALPLLSQINDNLAAYSLTPAERQDFYVIMIESARHAGLSAPAEAALRYWLRLPEAELDLHKLVPAVLLTAELLRKEKRLSKLRPALIRVAGLATDAADKTALYKLLVDIDRAGGNLKALKVWLAKLVSLPGVRAANRIGWLETLMLVNYQLEDFPGTVARGRQLLEEKPEFGHEEKLYFPFIVALGRLGKCSEVVTWVTAKLPDHGAAAAAFSDQRRLVLDQLAGSCLLRLGRIREAETFYRALYKCHSEPEVRIKLLAHLYRLAAQTAAPKELDEWVSQEVMNHFSLDCRDDEKLLKKHPELVLLVAECLFRERQYSKVLPSLLWLEKQNLNDRLSERVTFILAESYYRSDEFAEALARFELLYASAGKDLRYLAALRLVTIYETQVPGGEIQAGVGKLQKLYQDLLAREPDPALKLELKRKLKKLKSVKTDSATAD
jgi:tetratricopeptide (TPR) repeat protein